MRVATASYPVERLTDRDAWAEKATAWVTDAAGRGADLLVFPEYALIEPALAGPCGASPSDPADTVAAAAGLWPWVEALWRDLADRHRVTILAGSGPARGPEGQTVNRALLVTPTGGTGYQDKLILTPWERANTPLHPGAGQTVFDTPAGRVGIAVCYDAEFPLIARALVAAGARLLLVPACTDALTGATRVDVAARARALEGRVACVLSMTVGGVPDCPFVDTNVGRAAVYAPADAGWPDNGIVARGRRDAAGWVIADLDPAAGARQGEVDIPAHWPEQPRTRAATRRL